MNHPCQVQAIGKSWRLRLRERLRRGHSRHVCALERPGLREHEGDHLCRCTLTWAKQDTDNGPAPEVGLMARARGTR